MPNPPTPEYQPGRHLDVGGIALLRCYAREAAITLAPPRHRADTDARHRQDHVS